MIPREQYMADATLHHAYYLEIAEEAGLQSIDLPFSLSRVRAALANGDEHLNTLPLQSWDAKVPPIRSRIAPALKRRGDVNGPTLGAGVCVLKALAKHLARM